MKSSPDTPQPGIPPAPLPLPKVDISLVGSGNGGWKGSFELTAEEMKRWETEPVPLEPGTLVSQWFADHSAVYYRVGKDRCLALAGWVEASAGYERTPSPLPVSSSRPGTWP